VTAITDWAIHTDQLTKTFGQQVAVGELSLAVPRGSVFGFLGPNGSGKTTTIRMLLGLAEASSGSITVLGHKIPSQLENALPKVGALVEGPAFYPYLSGYKNLLRMDAADRFSNASTRHERVQVALARVGLTNAADKKAGNYSLGMKQRLGLANALLKPRELLILDEPTNGLDPQGTREVRNLIRSLAAEGITIFLSSHLLSEIEQLCSDVAVMSEGKLVAHGSLDDLRSQADTRLVIEVDNTTSAVAVLAAHGIVDPVVVDDTVTATVSPTVDQAAINHALVTDGVRVRKLVVQQPSLEEYFVGLTGEGFEVAR
jgi:ABC-type multidrug transport system ATPase subunit